MSSEFKNSKKLFPLESESIYRNSPLYEAVNNNRISIFLVEESKDLEPQLDGVLELRPSVPSTPYFHTHVSVFVFFLLVSCTTHRVPCLLDSVPPCSGGEV